MNPLELFPYTPRPHQRDLLEFLEKLDKGTHLVFEAANGAGKTIVALTAAIAYRDTLPDPESYRIVVLSRTNSQADRVIEELRKMKLDDVAMAKRGKEAMCNNPHINDYEGNIPFISRCEMTKKKNKCHYYTKYQNMQGKTTGINQLESIQEALMFLPMIAEDIKDEAEGAGICAAELSNRLVKECTIISGSYLYLFDEEIRHSFLKQIGVELSRIILVIDECHNLPNIVMQANEKTLSSYQIQRAKPEVGREKVYLEALDQTIQKIPGDGRYSPVDFMEYFESRLESIHTDFHEDKDHCGQVIGHLAVTGKAYRTSKKQDYCYTEHVVNFLSHFYNGFSKPYFTLLREKMTNRTKPDGHRLRFCLLDPATHIQAVMKQLHCSISMSGSLSIPAYLVLSGIRWLTHETFTLPSPYDPADIRILVTRDLTTMYKQRTPTTFARIGDLVNVMMQQGRNTGLFMPSYKVKDEVKQHIATKRIFEATRTMNSEDTDRLVEKFKKEHGALFISVMGGRSSEGTDFKGDSMELVIIAGIPYGMPDILTKARKEYFDSKGMNGFDLISGAPAFQQLSQAAGRPLRSLEDRVFVVITDYRVMKDLKKLPSWMHNAQLVDPSPEAIQQHMEEFYGHRD